MLRAQWLFCSLTSGVEPSKVLRNPFRSFLKCNRHFDEFVVGEKMARKMEDFPCIHLAFWRGRGQAGQSEPVGTCEKQMQCRFSLSVRSRWANLAGACPACSLHLLKSKPYKTLSHPFFTLRKFVKMPIEYPLPLSYD